MDRAPSCELVDSRDVDTDSDNFFVSFCFKCIGGGREECILFCAIRQGGRAFESHGAASCLHSNVCIGLRL